MARPAKLTPFSQDVAVVLDKHLSPAARSKAFAAFARSKLKEADATNKQALGYIPRHDTYVDGVKGASEDRVKPDGSILYEFDISLIGDVIEYIDAMLILHAPVLTGRFAKSFLFFADGEEADPLKPPMGAEEYAFINSQPYARKLERGAPHKGYSKQAPDGIFEVVAKLAQGRFGNFARVRFSYRSPLMPYVALGGRKGGKTAGSAKRSAHNMETESRTPAIVITAR